MWSTKAAFCLIILFLQEVQNVPKTYYFNINKTTNEYMIRTRLDPINSGHDYQRSVHLGELRNNVTRNKNSSEVYTHPLIDPEWDYNWKNITRRKLPSYIKRYHETFGENITAPIRFFFNSRRQNSTILQFALGEMNENISEAELHFYNKVDKSLLKQSLILRLYQMEIDFVNETALINPDAHKLLNVIYIYQAEGGWQTFKLTNALLDWFKSKTGTDLLLFITISKPNEEQFSIFKDVNRDASRTFMLLKSEPIENSPAQTDEDVISNNACRKHELHADFEKLNWMKFIISPPGYNAFTCFGTCYRNRQIPNHVKVTSLSPETSRRSLCCSAVKYAPLSIMFYDKNGNVAIKIYKDMIISACGCR